MELTIDTPASRYKKLKVSDLRFLGYELGDRQKPVGSKPHKYGIFEVKNEDNNLTVDFCLLYSTADKIGIILPHKFDYYLTHAITL